MCGLFERHILVNEWLQALLIVHGTFSPPSVMCLFDLAPRFLLRSIKSLAFSELMATFHLMPILPYFLSFVVFGSLLLTVFVFDSFLTVLLSLTGRGMPCLLRRVPALLFLARWL